MDVSTNPSKIAFRRNWFYREACLGCEQMPQIRKMSLN